MEQMLHRNGSLLAAISDATCVLNTAALHSHPAALRSRVGPPNRHAAPSRAESPDFHFRVLCTLQRERLPPRIGKIVPAAYCVDLVKGPACQFYRRGIDRNLALVS